MQTARPSFAHGPGEEDADEPTEREQYASQHCNFGASVEQMDTVLWIALYGMVSHPAISNRGVLEVFDKVMALAKQLPDCYRREFVECFDDAFPTLKGRYG